MNVIAIVQKPSIIREGTAKVIKENIPNTKVFCFDQGTTQNIKIKGKLPNILITNVDSGKGLDLIDYYISKNVKVVVWVLEYNTNLIKELLKRNIFGYFYNGMISQELIIGIRTIISGNFYIHPTLIFEWGKRFEYNRPSKILTKREWEVLQEIVAGLTNEKIAKKIGTAKKTVDNHIVSLMRKLDVHDRTSAAIHAIKMGWVKL